MAQTLVTATPVLFPQGIYELSIIVNSGDVQLSKSLAGEAFNDSDDMNFTTSVVRTIRSTGGRLQAVFTDATVTLSDVAYK